MKKQKFRALFALIACATFAFSACGAGAGANGGKELHVFLSMPNGSAQKAAMEKIVADFAQRENVKINFVTATASFEDDMKVKMASDSLPDVFSTHGWSVLRYAPFLEPLDNQPWVSDVKPGLQEIMFDQDGHIYALPLEYSTTGFLTNHQVLAQIGVKADALKTWDDFEQALAAAKAKGKIPFFVAGKNTGSGNLANFIASGAFIAAENEAFRQGEFDQELWQQKVTDRIEKWQKQGYFNPDYSSATLDDLARSLADGTAAFGIDFSSVLTTALQYNENADVGFIPLPGVEKPYVVGGEGLNAYGVAKTSAQKDLAIKFVNFIAQGENAQNMLSALAADSGLSSVQVNLGKLQPTIDKYVLSGQFPTKPFFDRVFLPSGMWDTLVKSTDGIITGQLSSAAAAKQMADQYQTLWQQQK